MHLHVLIGRTGVGKTARSIALAKQTGAPVIVLDRVQVYPELTIGSGRPLLHELDGTTRIYLAHRRVADGELSTAEAYHLALQQLDVLALEHDFAILEGGSISLCTMLFENDGLSDYPVTIEHLRVQDEKAYSQRQFYRILEMLKPKIGQPSILDELANVWREPKQRAFVQTVGGYSAIVDWCYRLGISPFDLTTYCHDPATRADLAKHILPSYLEYSYLQNDLFLGLEAKHLHEQVIGLGV